MGKNQILKLDNRLLLCAKNVRNGVRIADIGTDHAYLAIWLAINNFISHAIACDLREGPLLNAKKNISKYNVDLKIETRLSDGLDAIKADEVDDVIMAGMGGELIINIIRKAAWLKNKSKHLILQPMSAEQDLREFLASEGYMIKSEQAVVSYGKVYSVMSVFYDGNIKSMGKFYPFIGMLEENLTPESYLYIEKEIRNLKNRLLGSKVMNQPEKIEFLKDIISGLENMIKEN